MLGNTSHTSEVLETKTSDSGNSTLETWNSGVQLPSSWGHIGTETANALAVIPPGVVGLASNAAQALDHVVRQRAYRRAAKLTVVQKRQRDMSVRLEAIRTQKWLAMLNNWER